MFAKVFKKLGLYSNFWKVYFAEVTLYIRF